MRFVAPLIFASALLAAVPEPPEFRLSNAVRPESYQLDLTIRPDQPTYQGRVEIDVQSTIATDVIWLNGKDLSVQSASVEMAGKLYAALPQLVGGEFIGLRLDQALQPGKAHLTLSFTATLSDKASVGAYHRSEGKHWYVFTSFTAIDARRAFPCFDQPEFKTPWKVTIHVPDTDMAVANAHLVSESSEAGGLKKFVFSETKPLPTEVVAFAAGPFDIVEDGTAGRNRVPVRIIAPRGRAAEAAGARGATREILARLEDYTGIPYPWDKLDHIALLDMPFGATENPGLITYRDSSILATAARDTPEHRQSMRGVMAHELAHQWFGDLVTQRWWNDVWLSEGFASWLGTKIADLELPEAQRGVAAVQNRARIMTADNRPVRLDMHSRDEMKQIYSGIVYQKGAAVLGMTEHWLGQEPFRKGLQRYLKAHANSTATTADLAEALRAETGIDVC